MKYAYIHIFFALSLLAALPAKGEPRMMRYTVERGDTLYMGNIPPAVVWYDIGHIRREQRLIRNVKKVYPIAKEANRRLRQMEEDLLAIEGEREQREYIKQMERELRRLYTPVLQEMTFSQGKILIKLIDRETEQTPYELVRELRGGFSATFWQTIARIFGANLKDRYKKDSEDYMIERIILLYEAGLI